MQSEIARLLCLCLILVLPSRVGLATQPVPVRLTHVGKISLEARKVKGKMVLMDQDVVGTKRKLLCFGSGPDLYVYDISAPASPRLLLKKDVTGDTTNDANDLFAHDAPPHKIKPLCDGRYLLINLGARGLAVFDREGSPAEPEYLGLLDMDVVPISARPFVWDDALWVIADGPSDSKDNYVHIYTWKT